tara:strand:- start:417 stop:602 length:186 start_codon:yes stop_codon:yes gene_type:complete
MNTYTIEVDFDNVIEMEGIDSFNNLICELTHPDLQDIEWKIIKGKDCALTLEVTGYIEAEE